MKNTNNVCKLESKLRMMAQELKILKYERQVVLKLLALFDVSSSFAKVKCIENHAKIKGWFSI